MAQVGWGIGRYMTAKHSIKNILISFDGDAENILISF